MEKVFVTIKEWIDPKNPKEHIEIWDKKVALGLEGIHESTCQIPHKWSVTVGKRYGAIDVNAATKEELLEEHEECEQLWSRYSCEGLGNYITAIRKRIAELGGFPPRK